MYQKIEIVLVSNKYRGCYLAYGPKMLTIQTVELDMSMLPHE